MCICPSGYYGSRCETPVTNRPDPCLRVRCENGGTCRPTRFEARCLCQSGYHGIFCEQCDDAPDCAAGSFCVRTDAGVECRADICRDMCLNQGTCSVSSDGRVTCACPPQWSGETCERPACVDSDCATTNDSSTHNRNPNDLHPMPDCVPGDCMNGGRCVATHVGHACACAGPYGGARCTSYVGHDHACVERACPVTTVCVWRSSLNPNDPGTPFCACLEGARCTPPPIGTPPVAAPAEPTSSGGAWGGAIIALLLLVCAVLGAVYIIHRKRHGAFVHARLADNVEINNPMYLAGEDEAEPRNNHTHANGGNHFANPVYESMYAPQQNNPTEEHDNLLDGSGDGSPPPAERAALL
ncbi:hypothetical protein O0L34_g17771 [Tuta absoluta]|nr:hypothetical protein O0L34_g17771 [Tuta absoluta]